MVQSGPNGPEWSKVVQTGPNWSKWPKVIQIVQIGPNGRKWSKWSKPRNFRKVVFSGTPCTRPFADLTDVTLADEDSNSILADNAKREIQSNDVIQVM